MNRLIVPTVAAILLSAGLAPAQTFSDRGKLKLPRLFADATAAAAAATVQVQADGKNVALGTVVSADGYVLTKGTEVLAKEREGSDLRGDLSVVLRDGTSYPAKLAGYHKGSDLALLRIDPDAPLKPVEFADAAPPVGGWVVSTGPKEPVAVGVLSAVARPLYREENEVVQNLNRGYMGVAMGTLDDGPGAVVQEVIRPGPAFDAGVRPKDVIRALEGREVKSPGEFTDILNQYEPGQTVVVKIRRGEKERTVKVTLGDRAEYDRSDYQNNLGGSLSGRRTGFPKVIQHDAHVLPASCGGPLADVDGKVIGINIARAGRVETWALPAEVINPILKDLKDGKYTPVAKK